MLAVVVIAGTLTGVAVLNQVFRGSRAPATDVPTPRDRTTAPSVSAAPVDCRPSGATADFDGDGTPDRIRLRCEGPDDRWAMVVDWGSGASAIRPVHPCVTTCVAYATPDLDADGAAELAVAAGDPSVSQFSFLVFYRLPATEPDPDPIPLAATGVGVEGWNGRFELGGDEVFHSTVSCDASGRLVQATSQQRTDGSFSVRATTLELGADGFEVVGERQGSFPEAFETDASTLCGVRILDPGLASVRGDETSLPGVPYGVRDVRSILGDFGQGPNGVAYVFEESRPDGYEGFQHVAVAPDGRHVESISPRLISCSVDAKCWPFATPDIDGDGVDEVAVADGAEGTDVLFQLYRAEPQVAVMPGVVYCRNGPCHEGVGFPLYWGTGTDPAQRSGVECMDNAGAPFLVAYDAGASNGAAYEVLTDRLAWRPAVDVVSLMRGPGSAPTDLCGAPVYDFVPFSGR